MEPFKLFSSDDRNLTHKKLEEVLADGTFPHAFCQEDYNVKDGVYRVFHGLDTLNPTQLAAAQKLATKLKG